MNDSPLLQNQVQNLVQHSRVIKYGATLAFYVTFYFSSTYNLFPRKKCLAHFHPLSTSHIFLLLHLWWHGSFFTGACTMPPSQNLAPITHTHTHTHTHTLTHNPIESTLGRCLSLELTEFVWEAVFLLGAKRYSGSFAKIWR